MAERAISGRGGKRRRGRWHSGNHLCSLCLESRLMSHPADTRSFFFFCRGISPANVGRATGSALASSSHGASRIGSPGPGVDIRTEPRCCSRHPKSFRLSVTWPQHSVPRPFIMVGHLHRPLPHLHFISQLRRCPYRLPKSKLLPQRPLFPHHHLHSQPDNIPGTPI